MGTASGQPVVHARGCKCSPIFHPTVVLQRLKGKVTKEEAEQFYIALT